MIRPEPLDWSFPPFDTHDWTDEFLADAFCRSAELAGVKDADGNPVDRPRVAAMIEQGKTHGTTS